ncbi:MAG: UPF0175 family protein [Chloroflexi bacterium]|nr:UPF0175 family protein [Chloroflexota bacterium]MBI3733877.1 UPF0175 family protein [Chloroflexota bacterium]
MTHTISESPTKTEQAPFTLWPAELHILFQLGHWSTLDQILSEALETLLEKYPDLKLQSALKLYRQTFVSLSRAAEIAGIDRWDFREVLRANGIEDAVEVQATEEMDATIQTFKATRKP